MPPPLVAQVMVAEGQNLGWWAELGPRLFRCGPIPTSGLVGSDALSLSLSISCARFRWGFRHRYKFGLNSLSSFFHKSIVPVGDWAPYVASLSGVTKSCDPAPAYGGPAPEA